MTESTTNKNLKPCKSCGKDVAKSSKKCPHCGQKLKMGMFPKILIGIVGIVILGAIFTPKPEEAIASIADQAPSTLSPRGNLNEAFSMMSKYTNLQRDNLEKEITGQVVQWQLPIYEVRKKSDGIYRIQTDSMYGMVGTFITLYTQSEDEVRTVESLTTGKIITVKGRITGTSMRNIDIDPAILIH